MYNLFYLRRDRSASTETDNGLDDRGSDIGTGKEGRGVLSRPAVNLTIYMQLSSEVTSLWNFTATLPYVFMAEGQIHLLLQTSRSLKAS
jgi:hypothetical protein